MPDVWEPNRLVTHIVHLEGAEVQLDADHIQSLGIEVVTVPLSVSGGKAGEMPLFSVESVEWAMSRINASV